MSSELELLRQRVTDLEADKMELKRELKARNDELEKTIANSSAEIGKLNAIIVDLEKYKSAISKLESENAEFRVRFMKLEQDHGQTQDSVTLEKVIPEVSVVDIPAFVVLQPNNEAPSYNIKTESSEDKETDTFLDEMDKKKVGKEIKQRNKEKKLLRESATQEAHSISQNTAPTTSHERKNEQGLIREIISSKEEEEKHVSEISANNVRPNHVTEISANNVRPNRDIVSLYEHACNAEVNAIEANKEEILCWCFYAKEFKCMYKDFMVNDKVGEKKTKGQVYDFIIKQLPDTKRKTLCKQTQKALRIDDLFEKIGTDKIQYIKTYSADTISRFTNSQIQTIIDHFTKKPNMEFIEDPDGEKIPEETNQDDQTNVSEVQDSAEVSISTTPIPLAHDSNSSDNSKEEAWFDEDMFFNEANLTKVNTTTSDDVDVYFDEANEDNTHDDDSNSCNNNSDPDSNSGDEMPDDSDDDGYNKYGGSDKGYYYRDGRYERKVSPMMSPIISPVTA